MKITIESTDRVVEFSLTRESECIKARLWEGTTESGIKVYCLIPRIAVKSNADQSQFERELVEQRPASMQGTACFPLRMVL